MDALLIYINNQKSNSIDMKANWKILLTLLCTILLIIFGLLLISGLFISEACHIKQDAWLSEKPDEEPPIAVLMFTFTSKGDFTANYPIHVRIQMWVTVGINCSNVAICFPDSYAYPRNQTSGKPPEAGWIPISENGDRIGEGDIEFTSQGSFGYIIYSNNEPVYYAANQEIIHVLPHERRIQLDLSHKSVGIALIGIGISLIVGVISIKTSRSRKGKEARLRAKRKKSRKISLAFDEKTKNFPCFI